MLSYDNFEPTIKRNIDLLLKNAKIVLTYLYKT